MLFITGKLIKSITDGGHFGPIGLHQLRIKLFLYAVKDKAYVAEISCMYVVVTYSAARCTVYVCLR